jgi:4'-phosphopantetheinyl transferase
MSALGWLVCACDEVPASDDWLSPHERDRLAAMRLPKRRADFRVGRWAAKSAVRATMANGSDGPVCATRVAGLEESVCALTSSGPEVMSHVPRAQDLEIRAAPDGAPEVFLSGGPAPWAVSIAHSGGRGLAVVAAPGVPFGADLETVEPRSPAFMEDFFLASERAWVGSHPESARAAAATLVWSVKESVLKALRTGLREDTRAVETLPGGALFLPRSTATWRPVGALVRRSGLVFEGLATEREGQILTLVRLRSEGT